MRIFSAGLLLCVLMLTTGTLAQAGPLDCRGGFPSALQMYAANLCGKYTACHAAATTTARIQCCNQAHSGVKGFLSSWSQMCSNPDYSKLARCNGYSQEAVDKATKTNEDQYAYCLNPNSY